MPPELLSAGRLSLATDAFSFAILSEEARPLSRSS